MIKFINKELFNVAGELVSNEHGEYYKADVTSSMTVIKGKDKKPVHQLITKIISTNEDYNSNNTAISRVKLNSGNTKVSIKSSDRNKYDSRIFLIALPFNGLAKPLEESHLYKIHRGVIVNSKKRDIKFGDATYKKVLYLMITLNESVFSEDHKYHTDEIVLPFISYNLESVSPDKDPETVMTTTTITFTVDDARYLSESASSEPVNPKDFTGQLFKIYDKKQTENAEVKSTKKEDNYKEAKNCESTDNGNLDAMIAQYQKDASRNEKARNKKGKKKRR